MKTLREIGLIVFGLIALTLCLSACGSKDLAGTATALTSSASSAKSTFTQWTLDGDTLILDLTGMSCGVNRSVFFIFSSGAICIATARCVGNSDSGTMTFLNAGLAGLYGSVGPDPGCSSFNGSVSYANNGTTLTIINTGTSAASTYH